MNTSWLFVVVPVFDSAALLQGTGLLTQLPQSQANLLPSQQSISLTTQVPALLSSCQHVLPMFVRGAAAEPSDPRLLRRWRLCSPWRQPVGNRLAYGTTWPRSTLKSFSSHYLLIRLTKRHFRRHFQSFYVKAMFPNFVPSGCVVCLFCLKIFSSHHVWYWDEQQFFMRYHNIDNAVVFNYSVHMRSSW